MEQIPGKADGDGVKKVAVEIILPRRRNTSSSGTGENNINGLFVGEDGLGRSGTSNLIVSHFSGYLELRSFVVSKRRK